MSLHARLDQRTVRPQSSRTSSASRLRPGLETLEERCVPSLSFSPIVGLVPLTGLVSTNGVAVDSTGNAYVTGEIEAGIVNLNPAGQTDVGDGYRTEGFVAKYSTQGQFLWDWYFYDTTGIVPTGDGLAIALDSQGNPIVTGTLGSSLRPEVRCSVRKGHLVRAIRQLGHR